MVKGKHTKKHTKLLFICISRSYYIFYYFHGFAVVNFSIDDDLCRRQRLRSTAPFIRSTFFGCLFFLLFCLPLLLAHAVASIIIIIYGLNLAMWTLPKIRRKKKEVKLCKGEKKDLSLLFSLKEKENKKKNGSMSQSKFEFKFSHERAGHIEWYSL